MTTEKIRNRYLVQGSWLTELPTRAKPSLQLHDEKGKEQAQRVWHNHLASLPKICRCEGLKDGAIVEEKVDFVFEDKYIIGITEDGSAETTSGWRKVAIPLHREQGEDRISQIAEAAQDVIDSHHPSTPAGKEEARSELQFLNFVLKEKCVKHGDIWVRSGDNQSRQFTDEQLYQLWQASKPPSPQSEQAGEKGVTPVKQAIKMLRMIIRPSEIDRKALYSFLAYMENHLLLVESEYAALWQAASQEKGVGWVKASNHGLPPIEVVTLEQLIEHGKNNGANIVNNMPWSFKYRNHPVTHENDGRYLVGCPSVDCTKDNPVIFFCNKVFNYWKNPGRLNILYKGLPDVLITGEGNWCFWSGRAVGHAGIDEYRGSHIRVKEEDLKFIEWLDESSPRLQEAAEWVRVEDRLPTSFKDVLIYHKYSEGAHPAIGINIGFWDNKENWVVGDLDKNYWRVNATHWRPLPAPPNQTMNKL